MKPKRSKGRHEVPLTPEEQEIEDAIDPARIESATPAQLAEVRAALAELRERRRGGARPGAGRKPKAYVATMLNLTPEARATLERLAATEAGGMSAVVNRLLTTAR